MSTEISTYIKPHKDGAVVLHWTGPGYYLVANAKFGRSFWTLPTDMDFLRRIQPYPVYYLTTPHDMVKALTQSPLCTAADMQQLNF